MSYTPLISQLFITLDFSVSGCSVHGEDRKLDKEKKGACVTP